VKLLKLINLFNKLFAYDKWNIGYLKQTPEELINDRKLSGTITWLPEDRVEYAADPFPIVINGHMHLFYEELDFWNGKGELMILDDSLNFKSKKKIPALYNNRVHLSYPYTFTIKNKTYCIPESSEANEVVLYQVNVAKPQQLEKLKVLITGAYVDSSIIYYNKKYWLFTSKSEKANLLYIFYADSLLGQFKAHEQNPINWGANTTRSAGRLFIVNKKVYMPTQNHQNRYGGSVMINEITVLSHNEFKSESVFKIASKPPYDQGLHTINFCNGLLIVDGKRRIYSVTTPLKKLVRKIRNT
jgi:hypothetical protein